ncbi:hypothetical protein [Streptomyces sp. NPDC007905]|uniref:hypothetical protein n=1 Tax=Streptomyces sp. NPDC007905 TaxID=3364788 RepID=UPI0036E6B0C9
MIGRRIAAEAVQRGHQVVAASRSGQAPLERPLLTAVAVGGADAVASALAPLRDLLEGPGRIDDLVWTSVSPAAMIAQGECTGVCARLADARVIQGAAAGPPRQRGCRGDATAACASWEAWRASVSTDAETSCSGCA